MILTGENYTINTEYLAGVQILYDSYEDCELSEDCELTLDTVIVNFKKGGTQKYVFEGERDKAEKFFNLLTKEIKKGEKK